MELVILMQMESPCMREVALRLRLLQNKS
jgi:hypothetical protein